MFKFESEILLNMGGFSYTRQCTATIFSNTNFLHSPRNVEEVPLAYREWNSGGTWVIPKYTFVSFREFITHTKFFVYLIKIYTSMIFAHIE